ncbi:MAG: NHLP bacteriocin export ABC transporter permease/ATPase subunit [Clostridiaceae bacterium]|nr:NHLP bacteriocin export ABC transporter permease/ATPase subunit [Clostridiaceae bacterium]
MQSFDEKVKTRLQKEEEELLDSFLNLSEAIRKDSISHYKKIYEKDTANAVIEILLFLGAKYIDIPKEISQSDEQIQYLLSVNNIMSRKVTLTGNWWRDAMGPMLAETTSGDRIALIPSNDGGYTYFDVHANKRIKVNKYNKETIKKEAYCFYKPLPTRKLNLYDLLKYIFKAMDKADVFYALFSSLLVSLMGLIYPLLNKQIFEYLIPSGTKEDIIPMFSLLLGVAISTVLFRMTRVMILSRLKDKISFQLQSAIMMRVLNLSPVFFKKYSSGELASRVMSAMALCELVNEQMVTILLSALFGIVYWFQMNLFARELARWGGVVAIILILIVIVAMVLTIKINSLKTDLDAKRQGFVYQLFSGIVKIKLSGAKKRAFSRWATQYAKESKLIYSPPVFLKIGPALRNSIILFGSMVIYYLTIRYDISPSNYIAFNASYGALISTILEVAFITDSLSYIKPLYKMLLPVLEEVPEIEGAKPQIKELKGEIELSHVYFRYADDLPMVLKDISLKINAGESVGIVGGSGSGKSTLIRLILGFEEPVSGSVYFDSYDLARIDKKSVRQKIGVVLQNSKLMSGDIFSNIVAAAPNATLEDAWEAARIAGLEEDIRNMPMGMSTVLSEGSRSISGGQKQRLLIARAVAAKPKILIFDEATSALDNITQKQVTDALDALKCTKIIVAHRLSTIKNCDRIIVLDKGVIAEEGTYDELIRKNGLFAKMAARQVV